MKKTTTHQMNMICNIQSMKRSIGKDAGRFEEYEDLSTEELKALQAETLERYNRYHKAINQITEAINNL